MSNFQFISTEFPEIADRAIKAEAFALTSPVESCFNARAALELGVNWMYENDADLEWPYDKKLASLMHEAGFKEIFDPYGNLFHELHLIRKIGNNAVHNQKVKPEDSVHLLKCLFRFAAFLVAAYGEAEVRIPDFNDGLIPTGDELKKSKKEIELLREKLAKLEEQNDKKRLVLEEKEEANELLRISNLKHQEQLKEQRKAREVEAIPHALPKAPSEAYTRKLYIDAALKDAGWTKLRSGYELEFEVSGMPLSTNPTGLGYVDYVLWSDNGLPLAVIEAKKTTHDAKKGRHQASLYADCLEKKFTQRPLIYYTNGFDFYLWDDLFAPDRKVSGFMTQNQLELAIRRRKDRKDLRDFKVDLAITGRPYQTEAIQRVAENLSVIKDGKLKQRHRKSLLIMATGSGKTRTAASIVDMMVKCNWAKRILFLADRNALVTQAKNAFTEHLPELTSIDLTKEKENDSTRLVFSTYPTMMNLIDRARNGEGRFYGVGHFDLIIIDEAHRSVYQKYRAIFQYFDSFLLGLTATPKKDVDHNTYELFDIEDDNPTFAYELEEAVKDGFLVPPRAISVPLKFMREGIKYSELSEKEKLEYEEKFGDPTNEEAEAGIDKSQLYKWLFNSNTVDQVLNHLMTSGIKVDGGDKIGKTIIFAKNHKHAVYIEERFNKNYPEYSGKFCRVIDNQTEKAQDILERFKLDKEEKEPQIAISVDMMDTGVDAPRVVNLVFFKPVRSVVKFWQMIGRGTRLRPNLFGPDQHKDSFLIFDYCENFEFFELNPEESKGSVGISLTQQAFQLRLDLALALRKSTSKEENEFAEELIDLLHAQVASLNQDRFVVRHHLEFVEKYKAKDQWADLGPSKLQEIGTHIIPLILSDEDDDVSARRFDVLMLNYQLALIGGRITSRYENRITTACRILERKGNIPLVGARMPMIKSVLNGFLQQASVINLEKIRDTLRELMQFLDAIDQPMVETHFQDYLDLTKVEEKSLVKEAPLEPYRRRVERYLKEHKDHLVISKIKSNIPITEAELAQLQEIFFNAEEVGSKEEFEKEGKGKTLGLFIRELIGLDKEAVQSAFTDFIQAQNLNATQIKFMDLIIGYLTQNGVIDKRALFESPFKDLNDSGPFGLFDDAQVTKIISILDRINGSAGVG
ncbi:MAG: DEAD/DEAH box helicase family protein [Algoriphagus sp.]|uniref:DEAD/DEAH box helicase family protein n=1 Tax=Algoriphagus sp. TaxID=1872435 RepID=UPI00262D816D|nr:DEAD/DEAH box helicase family protein [Algoriphagus sp.]MDG1276925.1 DEAD/DEAH box helicase family protein [Algoriphagus sp.]